MCKYMSGNMCVKVGGQPQMSSLRKLYLSFEIGFLIDLELIGDIRLDQLASEPLGSIHFCLTSAGVTRMQHLTQPSYVSGGGTQIFMIVRYTLLTEPSSLLPDSEYSFERIHF